MWWNPLAGSSTSAFRPLSAFQFTEASIAKNRNTFAKRQREQDKKYRAEKKRERRDQRRESSHPVSFPGQDSAPDHGNDPALGSDA
jgi:hypothetical protein